MELFPPGVGFVPSDELLVSYYLANKNNEEIQNFNGSELIKELNLYQYDPFELRLTPSFSFRHPREFYCFTAKVDEQRRYCKTGFWMQKGAVRDITVGADNVVLGKKSLFFFYLGNSPMDAVKTSWTMYEYTLANKPQAPFVVCRVFDCPPGMDLKGEFGALTDVEEGDAAGDDSDVAQKPMGAGASAAAGAGSAADAGRAAEQGDASYLQASYAAFLDCVVFHMEAMTPEQLKHALLDEDFLELADFV